MSERPDKVSRIQDQISQMQARLKTAKAAENKRLRKEQDRKTYIHGGAFLAAMAKANPERRRKLEQFIDGHITRSNDRIFLGLKALEKPVSGPEPTGKDDAVEAQLPLDFKKQ